MPGTTTRTSLWAVTLIGVTAVLPAQEITWAGLPDLARSAPAARASQWRADSAGERQGLLGRSFQPRIGLGAFAQTRAWDQGAGVWPSASRTASWPEVQAGLTWNLWRGGRDQAASRVADAVAREAVLEAAIARSDLLLAIRQGYLHTSLLQRKLEILAEAEKQTQEDLAKAQKKAGAGFTSRTDVREFELRMLALQEEKTGLEDELDHGLASLATLAGLPRVELARMQAIWPEKEGSAGQSGLEERLLGSRAETERREAGVHGPWPRPAFDLGLGLIQGGDDGGFLQQQDYRASAGISLSLWDAGDASAARAALEKSAQSFEVLADAAKLARETGVDLARRRLERWLALRPQLELRVEAAFQFRQGVIQEYLKGVRDGRDLEEATKAGQEAQNSLEEARMTAWAAWSELQRLATVE